MQSSASDTKNASSDFIHRLYEAQSLEDKFAVLEKTIESFGFNGVLYTFFPTLARLTESLQPVFQFSESYSELLNNYQKNDYSRNDFVIRLVEAGELEIIDWWEEAKQMSLSDEEKKINHVTKVEYGVSKGITFPTLSNDAGLAGVSVISFKEAYKNKTIDSDLLNHLRICARMYHDQIMTHQDARYEFILPIIKTLTPKKKVVLKYLISGQPMKKINEDTDITTRYAEKLLVELRQNFGGISKNELIYLLGLINITEYL